MDLLATPVTLAHSDPERVALLALMLLRNLSITPVSLVPFIHHASFLPATQRALLRPGSPEIQTAAAQLLLNTFVPLAADVTPLPAAHRAEALCVSAPRVYSLCLLCESILACL